MGGQIRRDFRGAGVPFVLFVVLQVPAALMTSGFSPQDRSCIHRVPGGMLEVADTHRVAMNVARQAHNPEVAGSSPAPAIT